MTARYGDVTPGIFNEKANAIVLIVVGVFIFSTITVIISSFLTDNLLEVEDEQIEEKLDMMEDNLEELLGKIGCLSRK